MKLAREGYPFAAAGLVFAGACWVGVSFGVGGLLVRVLAWVFSVLAIFVLWFFRDPEPTLPADTDLVVSPGQGKILLIEDVEEPSYMAGPARKITIFLSVFDVHVQRAPVSGTVAHKKYTPGKFAVAWLEKASDDNEQSSLGIATPFGPVLVRQIAGLIARRIITDPEEGDSVERGRRFGLIRFGSRVDLFLPRHWDVMCAVGDRVRVGETILARQKKAP
ncbi:MAG: phosphatidylserine decarboxylase family protein [Gemmatimonadetes bacterium]|nr:phosphatidylserine decarboxylase family protein [Gemmatimonadota bacterium]MDA1102847.1 phosphatidylserine decarboxylase family protein [Gemmatimonadota bacterium]